MWVNQRFRVRFRGSGSGWESVSPRSKSKPTLLFPSTPLPLSSPTSPLTLSPPTSPSSTPTAGPAALLDRHQLPLHAHAHDRAMVDGVLCLHSKASQNRDRRARAPLHVPLAARRLALADPVGEGACPRRRYVAVPRERAGGHALHSEAALQLAWHRRPVEGHARRWLVPLQYRVGGRERRRGEEGDRQFRGRPRRGRRPAEEAGGAAALGRRIRAVAELALESAVGSWQLV